MNVAKMIVGGAAAGALTALTVHQLARAAERDHPPKGRFVESDGVRVHVLERGAGEPILYIHGDGGMISEVVATGLIDARKSHSAQSLVKCCPVHPAPFVQGKLEPELQTLDRSRANYTDFLFR